MVDSQVVVSHAGRAVYPSTPPFHPDQDYPESPFPGSSAVEPNFAYSAVREALRLSGLDGDRWGSADWNPLGAFIRPGQFVLLKPNLVRGSHPRDPDGWRYTLTHGSVIRAVADYVFKALDGRGRVMVADGPQTDSDFQAIVRLTGLDAVRDFYGSRGLSLELVDLRKEQWVNEEEVTVHRRALPGDPNGYVAFDFGDRSEFRGHTGGGRYYGADYDSGEVNRHHTGGRHEYLLAGSAIACDVFVNLPKLKTHKKTGVTVNLKNLVGVNGDKNWLPHHTNGSPKDGGDQYPSLSIKRRVEHASATALRKVALFAPGVGTLLLKRARKAGKKVFGDTDRVIRSGNWYGNDTAWRMCLDLNKAVLYGNPDGSFREGGAARRKTYLSFVDGIVGGEGNGPMDPDPVDSGVILFGSNPVDVDAAAAVLMGFSPDKIPLVRNAFRARGFPLSGGDWRGLRCVSDWGGWNRALGEVDPDGGRPRFAPHFGWAGHVER